MLGNALGISSAILLSEDGHFIVFMRPDKIFTPDEAKRRRFDFTDVEHISLMRNIVRVFFGNDVSAWKKSG